MNTNYTARPEIDLDVEIVRAKKGERITEGRAEEIAAAAMAQGRGRGRGRGQTVAHGAGTAVARGQGSGVGRVARPATRHRSTARSQDVPAGP